MDRLCLVVRAQIKLPVQRVFPVQLTSVARCVDPFPYFFICEGVVIDKKHALNNRNGCEVDLFAPDIGELLVSYGCFIQKTIARLCLVTVGHDAHAILVKDALASAGVSLDHVKSVEAPTGHSVVMLQSGGKDSIINFGGANVAWPKLEDGISRLTTKAQQLIKRAGAVLLQREISDAVNLEAAKVEKSKLLCNELRTLIVL